MTRADHLADLLQSFTPGDAIEHTHKARMLELLAAKGDPFSRAHYVPGHFTASAFIVSKDRDELLLILHSKLGLWLQPGGHIDSEDIDVIAAARREVAEEVNLHDLPLAQAGIFDIDIHTFPARADTPQHAHFDVRFLFQASSQHARAGSDAKDARWVKLDAVNELHADESFVRPVRKLIGNR